MIMYWNTECDKLNETCDECVKEFCSECIKEYCQYECKAGDLPEVCETCDPREELNCVYECDLSERLGCADCEKIRNLCIECDEVKTCDIR